MHGEQTNAPQYNLVLLDQVRVAGDLGHVGVRLALGADEAREGDRGELAGELAIGVDVANVDLHRRVVLGGDDAVGRRAADGTA